jgi:hypothetical protein
MGCCVCWHLVLKTETLQNCHCVDESGLLGSETVLGEKFLTPSESNCRRTTTLWNVGSYLTDKCSATSQKAYICRKNCYVHPRYHTIMVLGSLAGPGGLRPGCITACRLIVLTLLCKFPLAPPGAPTSMTWETSSRERGNCGWEMTGDFADSGGFHVIVGIFYMPQICDMGPTALLPLWR